MKLRGLLLLAVAGLLATTAPSEEKKKEGGSSDGPRAKAAKKGPDLEFTEDGEDLVVRLMIEGPKARQVVLTDCQVFSGKPNWDEPPIGVEKPRRPPRVELRYLVLINKDLPGFREGLMAVPTAPEVRREQRQEVVWRFENYRKWDFRREDATFTVQALEFDAWSEELAQALPRIKRTVDAVNEKKKKKGNGATP
jgi:hypothetical protein